MLSHTSSSPNQPSERLLAPPHEHSSDVTTSSQTEFAPSPTNRFFDNRIHSWYTSVMAFPDHLVASILDTFKPSPGAVFFDPHCGSGTALIEAQKFGLDTFGIDANPSSVLASTVKTNWSIDLDKANLARDALARSSPFTDACVDDPIVNYLRHSGMINRGWITESTAIQAAGVKRWIDKTIQQRKLADFFTLALISSVVRDLSNIKFGPELYCGPAPSSSPNPHDCIIARINAMIADLTTRETSPHTARVRMGDSRDGRSLRTAANWREEPAFIVTSPPYPTDHDYTRNSRLELVFMEAVTDGHSLRQIKKRMIRSHSKGIYRHDNDGAKITGLASVTTIRNQITHKLTDSASGFEIQYPKVISNYFGGMLRHFYALSHYVPTGSKLAYVVGDEASYKGVHIPTAQLLAEIIQTYVPRFKIESLIPWRVRNTHKNRPRLTEHVMLLEAVACPSGG